MENHKGTMNSSREKIEGRTVGRGIDKLGKS